MSAFDSELWDLPPEGTDMRMRVLKLLGLVTRSKHPCVLAPASIGISSSSGQQAALLLKFPRQHMSLSLRDAAKQGLLRNASTRRRIARQLVSTVSFLHRHGIYHNFLTSDEILLTGSVTGTSESAGEEAVQNVLLTHFFQSSVTPVATASYMCSRNYRPPEVILGYKADSGSVDMWLLGCLLFEIATGDAAFSLISSKENGVMKPMLLRQQLEQIVADVGPVQQDDVPKDFAPRHRDAVLAMAGKWRMMERLQEAGVERADEWDSVLRGCFAFCPEGRAAASDLLDLPLFRDVEADKGAYDYVEFASMDEVLAEHN
jgi:serine/threonine protein kinase